MRVSKLRCLLALSVASLQVSVALGQNVTVLTNTIGDVGNAGDITGYGAVNYQYSIGRYEVTNAQYTAFLNAKAATDTYGLYSSSMGFSGNGGITRSGSPGSYTYATVAGRENWAVNHVSFWDAARFVNWLENGQGAGDTETGTYTLGGVASPTNNTVTRNAGSTWAITSEDEWYKAAYYKGGGLSAGYWSYPIQSESITTALANFDGWPGGVVKSVGSYSQSSAYGAFDMAGNVWEWNESISFGGRVLRGGGFNSPESFLRGDFRNPADPSIESDWNGFRVSMIPSPSVLVLFSFAVRGARSRRRVIDVTGVR